MKIVPCKQGSDEWFAARRGMPTASCFDRIITPKSGKLSAQADDYICELVAESLGLKTDSYTSSHMQAGINCEPEARAFYGMEHDCDVEEVGFCLSDCGRFGCSPDGLVGDDGGLEIKCPSPKVHCRYLLSGKLPGEYKAQVHGSLVVTGRKWWDFISYSQGLPPFLIRVYPDEYTVALRLALETFYLAYQAALRKIMEMEPVRVGQALEPLIP